MAIYSIAIQKRSRQLVRVRDSEATRKYFSVQ
jgi:hypothetical protein